MQRKITDYSTPRPALSKKELEEISEQDRGERQQVTLPEPDPPPTPSLWDYINSFFAEVNPMNRLTELLPALKDFRSNAVAVLGAVAIVLAAIGIKFEASETITMIVAGALFAIQTVYMLFFAKHAKKDGEE